MKELEAGLDDILASPRDRGALKLIVQRPAINQRQSVMEGRLDTVQGLVGDNWLSRGSSTSPNASSNPEMQLNIMNFRVAALVSQDPHRMQLAGDQLYIDLDLSTKNLPPGTQLALGTAIIEVTPIPHAGCRKFAERFGWDAMKFVNSELGRKLNLRGINAKVVQSGDIKIGDVAKKFH